MAITVIKMAFQKLKQKITNYRNYNMFFDIKKTALHNALKQLKN